MLARKANLQEQNVPKLYSWVVVQNSFENELVELTMFFFSHRKNGGVGGEGEGLKVSSEAITKLNCNVMRDLGKEYLCGTEESIGAGIGRETGRKGAFSSPFVKAVLILHHSL